MTGGVTTTIVYMNGILLREGDDYTLHHFPKRIKCGYRVKRDTLISLHSYVDGLLVDRSDVRLDRDYAVDEEIRYEKILSGQER